MGEGNIGNEEIMGRYGAGMGNKEGLMFVEICEEDGFGDYQHLFQEETQTQGDV